MEPQDLQSVPATDRAVDSENIIVGTSIVTEDYDSQVKDASSKKFRRRKTKNNHKKEGIRTVIIVLVVCTVMTMLFLMAISLGESTLKVEIAQDNQMNVTESLTSNDTSKQPVAIQPISDPKINQTQKSSQTIAVPTTPDIQQPEATPVVKDPKEVPVQRKSEQGEPVKVVPSVEVPEKSFNPWDLTVEEKKSLLEKYKKMPKKDANASSYMPILQNYDEEIKPILEEFQKNMVVVSQSSLNMSAEQRSNYSTLFQEKLKKRLVLKNKILEQQKSFNQNREAFHSAVSSIKRGQWHDAFLYHTLVGVDLDKNPEAKTFAQKEVQYFEQKYNLSQYPNEITMCIVSPTYNNVDHDRFMWTLESILQQNYTNWRMVFIDDASSDKTSEKIAAHLKWRNISEDKVTVVRSTVNRKPMANIFYGSQKYCRLGEIQYVIDGDDELVGRQVFKVMNAVYQKNKFITVYSSHIIASGTMDNPFHYLGISKDYWQQDIQNNNFRKPRYRGYHHLRTMMSDTILLMRPSTFKDWRGEFYWAIGDNACYFPAMEMSCKRVKYLAEIFYIYNYNTGQTEDQASRSSSQKKQDYDHVFSHINDQKHYRCLADQFREISLAPLS